jgi:hypothetical protein
VKRAFQTLLAYVGNVAKKPGEEKFRKIRLSNVPCKGKGRHGHSEYGRSIAEHYKSFCLQISFVCWDVVAQFLNVEKHYRISIIS